MMKLFRRTLWTLGSLTLLLALLHLVENIRGRRAWQAWKSSQEAQGHRYDLAFYAPKAVPETENFATHPAVAGAVIGKEQGGDWVLPEVFTKPITAGDWREGRTAGYAAFAAELKGQSLETFLKPFDARLEALAEAARRPGSRLVANYANANEIPMLLGMRARARVLRLRALARLQAGRPEAALEDVLTGLRITQHFQNEPHVITQLLRLAYVNLLMQPVWEGIHSRAWNKAQLARLQSAVERVDLVASLKLAWLFERNYGWKSWADIAEGKMSVSNLMGVDESGKRGGWFIQGAYSLVVPRGWVRQNALWLDRYFQQQFDAVLAPSLHLINRNQHQKAWEEAMKARRMPYTWWAQLLMPALAGQNIRMARSQSGLDLAAIACALERHRLAKGAYPETLQALVPTYFSKLPHDVVDGVPLHYFREGKSYRLYAMGWNGTDEGGKVVAGVKDAGPDLEQGDWVWVMGS